MARVVRLVVAAAILVSAQARVSGAAPPAPSAIVTGVTQIVSPGAPGAVLPLSPEWAPVAAGDADTSVPSLFAIARDYALGRVVMLGHDGLPAQIGLLDNARFMRNTIGWLDVSGRKRVGYTTGHGEWLRAGSLAALGRDLAAAGYTLVPLPAPLSAESLAGVSVVIFGNAWGTVWAEEIDVLRQWVADGNGLFLAGLGWSWREDFESYPMVRVAAPFEARWVRDGAIADPTNQLDGSPVFRTFYPGITVGNPIDALAVLEATHAAHGAAWGTVLESNAALRQDVATAHAILGAAAVSLPSPHPLRQQMYDALAGLVAREPGWYARHGPLARTLPTATWLRERLLRTWYDCLMPTPSRRAGIAAATQMTGDRRDLFVDAGIALLDNDRLSPSQLAFVRRYFGLVPAGLHDLRAISVADFLGAPPLAIALQGVGQQMNIIGSTYQENSFPDDVAPGLIDGFAVVLAHEANHQVNALTIERTPALAARQRQLIARAGRDPQNYLRSMIPSGFFVDAPQEFFASIANQWFTDSARTVDLGIARFDAGRPEPINQALFFADVYSQGAGTTWFYTTDTVPTIERRAVAVHRTAEGFIDEIAGSRHRYRFTLDAAGRVTSYVIVAENRNPRANAGPDQNLECGGPGGSHTTLDASASSDPDGDRLTFEWRTAAGAVVGTASRVEVTVPLGVHAFMVTVRDDRGGSATDALTIVVRDTMPPSITSTVSRSRLWPPDRSLVDVGFSHAVTDGCHARPSGTVSVTADESIESGTGRITKAPDVVFLTDAAGAVIGLRLRAERDGHGDGRVYLVMVTATDGSGHASRTCRAVTVPHDRSRRSLQHVAAQAAAAVTACVPLERRLPHPTSIE